MENKKVRFFQPLKFAQQGADDLETKSVLQIDYGLFAHVGATLARKFGKVYYYTPWQDDFPSSAKQRLGTDLDGIIRVQNFWDYIDKVDLIVFFDTYQADLIDYLRKKGYRVWGAGRAESMEAHRWEMRVMQKEAGLPTQDTLKIRSVADLELYFKGIRRTVFDLVGIIDELVEREIFDKIKEKYENFSENYFIGSNKGNMLDEWILGAKNKYIKANMRGDIESFFAPDYDGSLSKLNALADSFGHRQDASEVEFVVENQVEGIEPGGDHIQINGEFLSPTFYGYEMKGQGDLIKACVYDELPKPIIELNDKLSAIIKKYNPTTSFFSTEFILGKDEKPYLIDPTVRNPAPCGTAIMSEMIENLAEVIWYGAVGIKVAPEITGKYGAGVAIESEWAEEHELEVEVDPSIQQFVKFRKAYKKNGKYYSVLGFTSICSVIGFGDTIKEAMDLVRKRMDGVKGYGLQKQIMGLDSIQEEVKKGESAGINF